METATDMTAHAAELAELAEVACASLGSRDGEPEMVRPRDGLLVLRHRHPSSYVAQVYDPVVCIVLHGAKEANTASSSYAVGAGQFLIVSHDMPVLARISQASPDEPYLALVASIDHEVLADLRQYVPPSAPMETDGNQALRVGDADVELIEAFTRYLRSLRNPADAEVLAPLAIREIHYRLLTSPQGQTLRGIVRGDGPAEAVFRAIKLIREDLAAQLSVTTIAEHVGLSTSALHHQFKAVTGTTPVQFHKQLRLLEARRLIQSNTRSVTGAAFSVGYSSATQFSREYRRAFGRPPSSDRVGTASG